MNCEPEAAILETHRHRTREEIREIYYLPLIELIFEAQGVHRQYHRLGKVQLCKLLSIKTGGCPEDCVYCPQSAHYQTGVERQDLMRTEDVLRAAQQAKLEGAVRFCMGAAWRQVPEGKEFETVLDIVCMVAGLGLEVCCTLGMLTREQALQLKQAGLTAYNHNLDTSPELYGSIITTRVYEERLRTIANVRQAGITVCCGTTSDGGNSPNCEDGCGVVFRPSKATAGGGWYESGVYSLQGGADGWGPLSGNVVVNSTGVYGMTPQGGDPNCIGVDNQPGCGVIYRIP